MSVSYTKTTWVNGEAPYINDDNLNHIEQGIADVASQANANETAIASLADDVGTINDAIDVQGSTLGSLKTDVGSLLAVANVEITGTMANASRFGDATAPTVSGYKFIGWINVASIGNISALYIASPTTATTAVWCVTTVNAGSNKTVRCTALYQKVVE